MLNTSIILLLHDFWGGCFLYLHLQMRDGRPHLREGGWVICPKSHGKLWIKDQNLGGLTSKSKLELARDKSPVKMNRLIVSLQRTGKRKPGIWNEIFAFWAAEGYREKQSMVFGKLAFLAHISALPSSCIQAKDGRTNWQLEHPSPSTSQFPPSHFWKL